MPFKRVIELGDRLVPGIDAVYVPVEVVGGVTVTGTVKTVDVGVGDALTTNWPTYAGLLAPASVTV